MWALKIGVRKSFLFHQGLAGYPAVSDYPAGYSVSDKKKPDYPASGRSGATQFFIELSEKS